jgi:hypothetical protein
MPSILDNAVLLGEEGASTYGTAVTATRGYEAKADTFKRTQEFIDSTGMRAGLQAQRSTLSRAVNMGGEGTIEADVLNQGYGLLLQAMLGTATGPTQQASTIAYLQTFATASDDPGKSYTIQVLRTDAGGTTRTFTHTGCVVTGWKLSHEVGGMLSAEFNFDFANVVTNIAAGTPTYPATAQPFDWTQASATWNSAPIDLKSFSVEGDLGMNTERRFLRGSPLKKRPVRSAVPSFEGSAEMEFDSMAQYDAFVAGTIAPMTVTWTGANIVSTHDFQIVLTMPAVQFQGSSPEVSLDDMPKIELPFKVLWNGTNPAISLTYKSTDTAR